MHDLKLRGYINELASDPEFVAEGLATQFIEETLRLIRERGLSQSWLAEKMGVSRAHVSKIMKAPPNMTLLTMVKIAQALGAQLNLGMDANPERSGRHELSIRLDAGDGAELRKIAGELGLGPSTLARTWILERLRSERSADREDKSLLRLVKEREVEYLQKGAKPWPEVERQVARSISKRLPKQIGPR